MELTKKPIKSLYLKYLVAAFGSALVGAVYILVDMAVIGQYAGPTGTAAIALVMPVWSFICSLGILTGIGGSVLYSNAKGESGEKKANAMFTAAVIATAALAAIVWLFMIFCDEELLRFLGSEGELLEIGLTYLKPLPSAKTTGRAHFYYTTEKVDTHTFVSVYFHFTGARSIGSRASFVYMKR